MNVKPGDLAIIIRGDGNCGRLVSVIEPTAAPHKHYSGLFSWYVKVEGSPAIARTPAGGKAFAWEGHIPDMWLRPVSGLPLNDEVTDDVKEPV